MWSASEAVDVGMADRVVAESAVAASAQKSFTGRKVSAKFAAESQQRLFGAVT